MASKCAREECGKTVYPTEELKCLDKVWHKGCFRCTACGMTLSMKTYKGYEKKPYCDAHYPKTVPSAVTDTLDMQRVKTNTQMQSQVKYHEAFEKMKGTKIEVADDPEMTRLLKNTQQQSMASYHGEQKKKLDQDQHREGQPQPGAIPATVASLSYFGPSSPSLDSLGSAHSQGSSVRQPHHHQHHQPHHHQQYNYSNGTQQFQFQPQFAAYGQPLEADKDSPYSQRIAQQSQGIVVYSSDMGGTVAPEGKQIGSIADYDPMNGGSATAAAATAISPQKMASAQAKKAGSQTGFTVKALYDYTAADNDEVSFKEGDIIVNCQKVDDGWITGTVQRTLMWGMLPANYVEKMNQPTGMFRMK